MTAHFNGRNGTEILCCDVIVVLNIAAFLRQWFFRGEGFVSKYKPYFTREMAEEFVRVSVGIIRLFYVVFCLIASLQRSIVKLKIVGTASFLITIWRSLKEGPNKLLTTRLYSKPSSVKCFPQTRECFEGMKHSLFIFISHSLLSFGSWGNLKVLTFDFEWFSSEVHSELESKTVSNFPHFLSSPTVTSQVLFPTIIRQFSRPLDDYEG